MDSDLLTSKKLGSFYLKNIFDVLEVKSSPISSNHGQVTVFGLYANRFQNFLNEIKIGFALEMQCSSNGSIMNCPWIKDVLFV